MLKIKASEVIFSTIVHILLYTIIWPDHCGVHQESGMCILSLTELAASPVSYRIARPWETGDCYFRRSPAQCGKSNISQSPVASPVRESVNLSKMGRKSRWLIQR